MIPDSTTIIKLANGAIEVQATGGSYTVDPTSIVTQELYGVKVTAVDRVIRDFKVEEVKEVIRDDGTVTPITDSQTLFDELKEFFFFSVGSGGSIPSGSLDAEVIIQTLNDGDNTVVHALEKTIIGFSVKFNNEFIYPTGSVIDDSNFNINVSGGGPLSNSVITFFYMN